MNQIKIVLLALLLQLGGCAVAIMGVDEYCKSHQCDYDENNGRWIRK